MKSKKKVSINVTLSIVLILSMLELMLFIALNAGTFQRLIPALCKFSCIFLSRYLYVFEIVNSLSLSYIMSYIFYMVVSIPENRKQKSINKYVSIYLTNIYRLLDDIIKVSSDFTTIGCKILNKSPNYISILRKDTCKLEFLTYKEHFIKFYMEFKEEYQHLSHYIAFIDDDLRDCLYEIVTCSFLNQISNLLVNANNNELDNIFEENFSIDAIFELNIRLKQCF